MEWFISGTQQARIAMDAPASTALAPRITSPSAGAIIALDPDIPPARQRLAFTADGDRLRCEFDLRRRLAHGVPPGTTAH